MKTTCAAILAMGAALLSSRAGNVSVVLDSTNGASGFQVLDAQSNALFEARSDRIVRVGGVVGEEQADQSQGAFTGDFYVSNCWQSFTVGLAGDLSTLVVWHNQFVGNENLTVNLYRGVGTTGTVLWSHTRWFDEYWERLPVSPGLPVHPGDVLTFGIFPVAAGGVVALGESTANPYAGGQSCRGPNSDLLFNTWVIPTEATFTVGGDVLTTGTVTAAAFHGDGVGLTNIGNAALAASAAIDPAKIAGTSLTQSSSFGGDLSGTFGNLQVQANAIGGAEITNNAVVRSLNGFRDAVTIQAGSNIAVSNASGTITVAAGGPGVGVPSGAIVLSTTATNRALEQADFSLFYAAESRDAWTQATAAAGWAERTGHTMLSYNGRLWVLGGLLSTGVTSDVWSSTNGANWTLSADSPGWSARHQHASVVFNNRMWVLGGSSLGGLMRDVWWSTNGVNWTQATAAAAWTNRSELACVVFNGKMWVVGGRFDEMWVSGQLNDVWSSSNGVDWVQATAAAPWSIRSAHGAVVYDNKMWMLGGYGTGTNHHDVWSSTNGANWAEVTAAADWPVRNFAVSLVYDGRMWILGGAGYYVTYNDVWCSTTGDAWTQITNAAPWTDRGYHAGIVHDDRLWIAGGLQNGGTIFHDVWYGGKPDLLSGFYLYQKQ